MTWQTPIAFWSLLLEPFDSIIFNIVLEWRRGWEIQKPFTSEGIVLEISEQGTGILGGYTFYIYQYQFCFDGN